MSKPAPESSATSLATPPSSASTHSSACLVSTPLATDEIKAEIDADVTVVSDLNDLEGFFGHMIVGVKRHLEKCDLSEAKLFLYSVLGTKAFGGCDDFEELLEKLQQDCHIDIFNIFTLQQLVACLDNHEQTEVIEAYNKKKESFLEQTAVLEFQNVVVNRVEPILASGMAMVTIKIPKKMARHQTLKDIDELAMDIFRECHSKFIRLHVHAKPDFLVISWVFPKGFSGRLEQLACDNAAINNGVVEVTVGVRVFPCSIECRGIKMVATPPISASSTHSLSKPALESSATSLATPPSSASTHSSACLVSTPLATDEIKATVVSDLNNLVTSFGCMIVRVKRLLEKCDLSEAKLFLYSVIRTKAFSGCDDFEELLEKLQQDCHIDIFNISILQKLVACLGNHEQTEVTEPYHKKKESFLEQTAVLEFQNVVDRVEPILVSGMAMVTIKIPKKMVRHRTLKDIEELAMDIFKECHSKFIRLHVHAKPGSIVISWVFPEWLSGRLEQLARDNAAVDNGKVEVTVGGRGVFPRSARYHSIKMSVCLRVYLHVYEKKIDDVGTVLPTFTEHIKNFTFTVATVVDEFLLHFDKVRANQKHALATEAANSCIYQELLQAVVLSDNYLTKADNFTCQARHKDRQKKVMEDLQEALQEEIPNFCPIKEYFSYLRHTLSQAQGISDFKDTFTRLEKLLTDCKKSISTAGLSRKPDCSNLPLNHSGKTQDITMEPGFACTCRRINFE